MARLKKYALYKGDELVAEGTIEQIATKMGMPQNTVRFFLGLLRLDWSVQDAMCSTERHVL